ncbi:hypothetical protein ACSX1A_15475 [Pontibacter sp. MBLB2868]|uniref:hypothetical protein n=1 Tax=Pontibacter sp. MBLB2868 TaxID=3451555 RepID=UPI003F74C9F1
MFSSDLPKPVLFHPLKHHLGHIVAYMKANRSSAVPDIQQDLLTLGTSQLDLYCGPLTPLQIAQETIDHLEKRDLLQPEKFSEYLSLTDNHYRCITLSDSTDWVLRWGVIEGRYVHLHPARYAPHTIRVKAAAIKTAIAAIMASWRLQTSEIDAKVINNARKEWLRLAPIKKISPTEGVGKILGLLLQKT